MKLTPQEQELLYTKEGAFAVIMGYLKSERGRVAPSVFNKIASNLGYDKQTKTELTHVANCIENNEILKSLFKRALNREIKLDEIPNANEEPSQLGEENLFKQITNYLIDHEDNNARIRELRKLQREGVYMELLIRDLKKHLKAELMGMPRAKYLQTPIYEPTTGDKSLVLVFSDWHIGFTSFNMETGNHNFDRLTTSINEILAYAKQLVKEREIKHIYVVHLGDISEKVDMRNVSQAYDAQFPFAEQVAKGVRAIAEIIADLSKHAHVTFAICGGNHDRMTSQKSDVISNDSASYIVLDMLFMLQEDFGQLPNVTLIDNRNYIARFDMEVAGKKIVGVHGDHIPKKTEKIPTYMKDGKEVHILLSGHLHSTLVNHESFHRLHIQVGSMIGSNSYAKDNNFPLTGAAQMAIILTEGSKSPEIIPLMLDNEGRLS